MSGPPPATATLRLAIRRSLADLPADGLVLAAVSGGADSLALAAALAFSRPGSGAVVVDHGLQAGSSAVADRAAGQCRDLGLDPVEVLPVAGGLSGPGGGPEATARDARYAALSAAAGRLGAVAVLLGHTRSDQAETVLLGLARGAGARALAGMSVRRGIFRRPLLEVDRGETSLACAQAGLEPWSDPHNDDPRFARVRVRANVLPVLERDLGPGIAAALARSARSLREDADLLDALTPELPAAAPCSELAALAPALRSRALKAWAERACGQSVTSTHVDALRALVDRWSGQGAVALPGGARVIRTGDRLTSDRDG